MCVRFIVSSIMCSFVSNLYLCYLILFHSGIFCLLHSYHTFSMYIDRLANRSFTHFTLNQTINILIKQYISFKSPNLHFLPSLSPYCHAVLVLSISHLHHPTESFPLHHPHSQFESRSNSSPNPPFSAPVAHTDKSSQAKQSRSSATGSTERSVQSQDTPPK